MLKKNGIKINKTKNNMGIIDNHGHLSQEEAIEILQSANIPVIWKPVALMPNTLESVGTQNHQLTHSIETDIYEAVQRLERIHKIVGDPFSK